MDNTDNEGMLETYIYRLYRLRNEKQDEITREDLQQAAYEAGLTDKDLEELENKAAQHIERGNNYLKVSSRKFAVIKPHFPALAPGKRLLFFLDETFYEHPWGYPQPFHRYTLRIKGAR